MQKRLFAAVFCLVVLLSLPLFAQIALVGGTIYPNPTEEAIRDGVVLVRDGKVSFRGAVGVR